MNEEILNAIPHRPPFLFVDEIVEQSETRLTARKRIDPEEPFFKGHYPDYPIMPGVLVCECVFQAGALLVSKRLGPLEGGVPVLTRIANVKFKNPVRPGDMLEMSVDYVEQVGPAHYMKGKAAANGKTVLTVEFTAMLTGADS
ncbi:MAG: 3-hydroxyacyl-ACP dehydratase FabZ [Nitrospinaceae bacterium]|nr:beta-hydroxyacyl-ACP dehydratase [Nitrospinaceae bacterium]NIR56797.1 beta-hydroxyacyl-ACP dehydratase [Nitrospinaceae bacterium]NIS87253.1 beta-hydroxyacyl-ACP dehydratase [Nitrospinaceae bacterium]NIT82407.1 beta-hydroxyacyl-ACP dehydratase [Nitrospinaceae bacterium]NIU44620.1 beta-hydroxyacyl-ACP dehydratase [Nitrospinaceae bacterium]